MTDVVELKKRMNELEALFLRKQDAAENFQIAIKETAKRCECNSKALGRYVQASAKGTREQVRMESTETVDLIELLEAED